MIGGRPLVTMRRALSDPNLLGNALPGESWQAWRILLIAMMGEALDDDERAIFERLTGREREPIIRWGLSDRLLDIAENYLGVPVGYDGANVYFTKADGMEAGQRRWHRDAEDRRMLKIALYLNDVDEDGGPLQVLRRQLPDHDRVVRGKFPILSQEKLETALGDFDPDRDVVTCTGKAGTMIFADTAALYHRGKPASARDRCAIFFNCMKRTPLRPFRCERATISRAQTRRLAASMPQRQRDCLLWRDSLPLVARMVPPAPVWK